MDLLILSIYSNTKPRASFLLSESFQLLKNDQGQLYVLLFTKSMKEVMEVIT